MDIPVFAELASKGGVQRQGVNGKAAPAEIMEPQPRGTRPVWAGPSWPIANSVGGARSTVSGTSPYGKSIDMTEAIQHLADGGEDMLSCIAPADV